MREILFRAKRLDNGEWVEGYLTMRPSAIQIGDYSPWYISVPPVDPDDDGGFYNVDPATIGQYTDFQDRYGKRIFEGDIVCCIAGSYRFNSAVVFASGEFLLAPGCMYKTYITGGTLYPLRCYFKEVIGNFHDNPELLEGDGHE